MASTLQGLIIGAPISQYASYSTMFYPLHSNISKEQHEKHLCNPSNHYRNYRKFTHPISRCLKVIHYKLWEVSLRFLCLTMKSLCAYHKLSSIRSCKERMEAQRGTKAAPWCKHCSFCGWWKGTSWDKATLISKEIKSVAL